jgi:hypothetical protein
VISAAAAAHHVWAATALRPRRRFQDALSHPAEVQSARLRGYLQRHGDTAFGRAHGFARIRSFEQFQAAVPIATYDRLAPYVDRIAAGERDVLTADPVRRLQPSSGSTAAIKRIPYTRALQREISAAVDPWIADLYLTRPDLMRGRAYWSITPPVPSEHVSGAVPVGFEDDSRYLGGVRGWLARAALIVPPVAAGALFDVEAFRRATLHALLLAGELRLISVWHPSFLGLLLDTLTADWDGLLASIARSDRRRAAALARLQPDDVRAIWPRLKLVSCWADGPASGPARALADRLHGVEVQAKGLMATEGVVSIPFAGRRPVAICSHVYEFVDDAGRAHRADQVELGAEYSVVITTGAGLYRYRLGDRVRIDGFVSRTPSLTFVGRDDRVSDRCGEKLSDGFVAGIIAALCRDTQPPRFAMLAPDEDDNGCGYTLFVDREFADRPNLRVALERALRGNPHYSWCVDLGQLRPARVAPTAPDAERRYVDACVARGRRLGDVKPVSLDTWTGWRGVLSC